MFISIKRSRPTSIWRHIGWKSTSQNRYSSLLSNGRILLNRWLLYMKLFGWELRTTYIHNLISRNYGVNIHNNIYLINNSSCELIHVCSHPLYFRHFDALEYQVWYNIFQNQIQYNSKCHTKSPKYSSNVPESWLMFNLINFSSVV